MKKAKIVILEGTWWSSHEVPQVLPYFDALANTNKQIDLSHRTFRNVEDIEYYVGQIKRNAGVFLYIACHGKELSLKPAGNSPAIELTEIASALENAKPGAIEFIHFACCEMINPDARRETHQKVLDASGARWVSGYTVEVDWIQSMFLELALVTELFVGQKVSNDGRVTQLKRRASRFYDDYEQLARRLGFSALTRLSKSDVMFPERLHSLANL